MFSTINHIGTSLSRSMKIARGKTALAAATAVAALGLTTSARANLLDVESITTKIVNIAPPTVVNNVTSDGNQGVFHNSKTYNMHYAGNDLEITSIVDASGTYVPSAIATTTIERGAATGNTNTDVIWFQGSGSPSSKNIFLQGPDITDPVDAFKGNNLYVGSDNLFTNSGNPVGNDTNIERLDTIFNAGFKASSSEVFSIFERGFTTGHDGFKIAAITGLDKNGNPSNYGPLLSYNKGTWGEDDVLNTKEYIVTRSSHTNTSDPQHPSDEVSQPIGGVVIPTTTLASAGETIYGYSLFAPDVNGSGTQLVNWNDTSVFPINTPESVGGIDPAGVTAVLYTSAIPEPTTAAIGAVALGGMLVRRPRRNKDKVSA
jgi:hypothetical protein